MFDPAQYLAMKNSITRIDVKDDIATVSKKAFDPDSGLRADEQIVVSLSDLQQRVMDFQDFITNVQAFLSDAHN